MKNPCICTNLRQAAQASTAYYDTVLAPSGLKVTMFRLLRRIGQQPDISISALAHSLDLDRSTLGRNLRVVERQGYVQISTANDGRERSINLTNKGAGSLNTAIPLWDMAQATLSQELEGDLDHLLGTLSRITQLPREDSHAS